MSYRGRYLEQLKDIPNPARLVFMHRDFVVKVDHLHPSTKWQTRQTAREIDFWETLTEDHEHFAKILDYGKTPQGKWWLKQERLYPDAKHCEDFRETLLALEFKYNLRDLTIMDTAPFFDEHSNWMCSQGKVVVYDWGGYTV